MDKHRPTAVGGSWGFKPEFTGAKRVPPAVRRRWGLNLILLVPNVALQLSEGGWNLNLILRVSNVVLQLSEGGGSLNLSLLVPNVALQLSKEDGV